MTRSLALLGLVCCVSAGSLGSGEDQALRIEEAKHLSPLSRYFSVAMAIALPERKEYVTKFLEATGLPVEIIDAVTVDEITPLMKDFDKLLQVVCDKRGVKLPLQKLVALKRQMVYNDKLKGSYWAAGNKLFHSTTEIAIFVSHLVLAAKIVQMQGFDFGETKSDKLVKAVRAFVVEDDVSVSIDAEREEDLEAQIHGVMDELPKDWDIIFFGWCHEFCLKTESLSEYITKSSHPLCPHAFGVTAQGALKLLVEYNSNSKIVDHVIGGMVYSGVLKAYSSNPPLIDQGFLGSSWNAEVNSTSGHAMCQENFLNEGHQYLLKGQFDYASQAYKQAGVIMPDEALTYMNEGYVHFVLA